MAKTLTSIACPLCGAGVQKSRRSYCCSRWQAGCAFTIWINAFGHVITDEEAQKMAAGEEAGPFVLAHKDGTEYLATLYYDRVENKTKYRYAGKVEKGESADD